MQVDSLPAEPQEKPKNIGVGSLSLLQWIFPTQESNQGLLHCRRILYQLSHQGSPNVIMWLLLNQHSSTRNEDGRSYSLTPPKMPITISSQKFQQNWWGGRRGAERESLRSNFVQHLSNSTGLLSHFP